METKYLLIKTDGHGLDYVGKFVLKDNARKVMQEDWELAIDNCPGGCFVIPGKTTLVFEAGEATFACDGDDSELILWKIFSA